MEIYFVFFSRGENQIEDERQDKLVSLNNNQQAAANDPRVRFIEKSSEQGKPRMHRRPTGGKALLDPLDDAESSEDSEKAPRVHFTKSATESSESSKPRMQRRPTDGKALMKPHEDVESSEDSEDENIEIESLVKKESKMSEASKFETASASNENLQQKLQNGKN